MRSIQTLILLLFLAGLGLAPALFGGNIPLAWGINASVFGLLLALYAAALLVFRIPFPVPSGRVAVPFIAISVVVLWCLLQTQNWVPALLHDPFWQRAAEALSTSPNGAMSVNPGQTLLSTTRLVTAAVCFFLAVQLARDPLTARRMVVGIAIVVAIHALIATFAHSLQIGLLPWISRSSLPVGFEGQLAGTFINQNHFAIFLGLGVIAAWSLFERELRDTLGDQGLDGGKEIVARVLFSSFVVGRYALLFVPLLTALLLTGSRAGFLGSVLAILVMFAVAQKGSLRLGLGPAISLIVIAAVGGLIALFFYGGRLGTEISESSATDLTSRLKVARIALHAIADRPFKGFGFGTFSDIFPLYRDGTLPILWRWEEAHNSYLEAIAGLGIPIALVLFAGLAWVCFQCLSGAIRRKRDQFAPTAAVGASILVGLHSLIDFSIQIEGVTLIYAALLGAGYAQSWSSREA